MTAHILQLTDLHLRADSNATLKGVVTRDAFLSVWEFIQAKVRSGVWSFDLIVFTGDLAHDERMETYRELREIVSDEVPQCRFLPGNHDDRSAMREVFPEAFAEAHPFLVFSEAIAGWRLIGLDSHVPGEVPGAIDDRQLAWLSNQLAAHADEPTLLFIHHPPFSVHSDWLDALALRDPDGLLQLVQAHPHVRVISTGHVHQEYEDWLGEVRLLTTPSTAVQFQPRVGECLVDSARPGFRIFRLDGSRLETEVIRLP